MNNNDGKTWFGLGIDNSGLRSDADKSIGIFNQIGNKAEVEGARIDTSFKRIAGGLAGMVGAGIAKNLIDDISRVRNEFEQLEISFNTMLGSKEKADALMKQALDTAAKTPFDLSGVASGYKQLLAYGIALEKVDDTLKMVGDVASGVSAPLNDIVYLYGTLNASGRVALMDIRQFAGRGIPIYEELAKVLGIAKEQVNEFASDGKISFEHVEQAFKNMTSEGGRFNNLMEAQSKSIGGMKANFGDAVDQMKNDLGMKLEPIIKGTIKTGIELAENYEEIGKILISLALTYGSYKAAVIAVSVANTIAASAAKGYTTAQMLQYRWLLLSEKAQKLLNATMLKNPVVFVATAVMALVAGLTLWANSAKKVVTEQELLNDVEAEAIKNTRTEKNEISTLKSILNDANSSYNEKKAALDRLKSIVPDYHASLTAEGKLINNNADALDGYVKKLVIAEKIKLLASKSTKASEDFDEFMEENKDVMRGIIRKQVNNEGLLAGEKAALAISGRLAKDVDVINNSIENLQKELVSIESKSSAATTPKGGGGGKGGKSGNAWDAELKDIEDYAKKQEIVLLTMRKNNIVNEEAFELLSQQILLNSLQKKIELYKKYGQNTLDAEKEALTVEAGFADLAGKIPQKKIEPFDVAPIDKEKINEGLKLYLDYVAGKKDAEQKYLDWLDEQEKKKAELLINSVYAVADIFNSVGDVVDSFGGDTRQLDNVTKLVGGVATAGQGVAKIMSGDIVGGITDTVRGLADIIVSINAISDTERQKEIEKMQDKVEGLQEAYDNLGDKIEKAYSKDASKMIEQQNVMIKQQQILIKQQIEQEKAKKKTDDEKIKAWENEYENLNKLIEDNKEKAVDVIFGEDVKSAIDGFAEAYVSAWEAGDDKMKSSKDLAKKMIKSMLVEAMKANIGDAFVSNLRAKMKEFMDNDGRIDSAEQTIIDSMVEGLTKQLDAEFGWADAYLRGSSSQGAASYGAYEKITQEQASGIDGRLTGIHMEAVKQSGSLALIEQDMKKVRDNTVISGETLSEMRDIALLSVGHLERIGKNTNELYEMNARLGRIEKNTSNL